MKTYLNVPYAQKDYAKAHGAKWDREMKKWYVESDVPNSVPATLVQFFHTGASFYQTRRNAPIRHYTTEQRAKYNFMRGMP